MEDLEKMNFEDFSNYFKRRLADTIIKSGFLHLTDVIRDIIWTAKNNKVFGRKVETYICENTLICKVESCTGKEGHLQHVTCSLSCTFSGGVPGSKCVTEFIRRDLRKHTKSRSKDRRTAQESLKSKQKTRQKRLKK